MTSSRALLHVVAAMACGVFAFAPAGRSQVTAGVTHELFAKAPDADAGDRFGYALAASGNTLVVGAPREDSAATGVDGDSADDSAGNSGAAYVYVRDGAGWSLQAYLKASNTGANDGFGSAVAICGDTLVVGAIGEASASPGVDGNQADDSASSAGAAYVFVRDGGTWTQQAYLKSSAPESPDRFGFAVALAGNTVLVSADLESSAAVGVDGDDDDNSAPNAGAAYVFVRDGTAWSQQAYLKPFNTDSFLEFGTAVALSGDTVVVGSWIESSNATGVDGDMDNTLAPSAGAAYVFERRGSTWSTGAYLKASNTAAGDEFGSALSLDGDTLAVGAWGEDSGIPGDQGDDSASRAGAVYVFGRSDGAWAQSAYLKSSHPDAHDNFGRALSLEGDVLAVGVWGEDGGAAGVDGDAADNSVSSAGAAFLFGRSGSTFNQLAYLKASNTGAGDLFGAALAFSARTLAVGAFSEDSDGVGLDGEQANDLSTDSGAAYLFRVLLEDDPWQDLGFALAGLHGEPQLVGSGTLAPGDPVSLALTEARENAGTYLVVGAATVNLPFYGGTLVPAFEGPLGLFVALASDAAGELTVSAPWPAGVPTDFTATFQCWIVDAAAPFGLSASNAISGTTP